MSRNLWDANLSTVGHLMVQIVSAKGLGIEKPTELFVRVASKTFKDKTKITKKETTPVWQETFYIDQCPASLDFSIHSPDGLSDKFWGECTWDGLQGLQSEVIVEQWIDVIAGSTKTKRSISGQLQVRLIRTTMPSQRSLLGPDLVELHYTHRRLKKFKTGDLILYSGSSPQHLATRLDNETNYSNIGILIELPNKWTKTPEWYVLEASENAAGVIDPFADTTAPGLRLFKLDDVVHSFHGAAMWWVPQHDSTEEEARDLLKKWALLAHEGSKDRPFPPPELKNMEHIGWKQFEQSTERIKLLGEFYERTKSEESIYFPLHAPQLVGYSLAALGIVDTSTTDVSTWTIQTVLSHPHFNVGKQRILRVFQSCHGFYTAGNTDKNSKLDYAHSFKPIDSFAPMETRVPSEKAFSSQAKQLSGLQAAVSVQISKEESNLLHAASSELLRKKKKSKA